MTAFISVGGNKEKIDDFCGSGTPRELMSNSAVMSLHFHSTAVSRGSRGFKARYSFVSSITTTSIHLFKVEIHFRSLNSLFFFRFRNHDRRANLIQSLRLPIQQHHVDQRHFLEPQFPGILPARHRVSLLLPRPGRRAGENRLLLFRH